MNKLLFLLICILMVSCGTFMPNEKFFGYVRARDIPDVSLDFVSFRTSYIGGDCISCGTISEPLFDYNIKYDTLSHYRVIVLGKIVFEKDSCQKGDYKRADSVGIHGLIVDRLYFPRVFYSDMSHKWNQNTPWKECPLPKKILKKIRKDFLMRKKYVRYAFEGEDVNSVSESYCYRLY